MSQFALPVIFGAATGLLSGSAASEQNKAAAEANKENQQRFNAFITQADVERRQEGFRLALRAQEARGQILNAIPPENIAAVRVLGMDLSRRVAADQFAIEEEFARQQALIEAQKRNSAAVARNQQQNVFAATVTGGAQGFLTGVNIVNSWHDLQHRKAMSKQAAIKNSLLRTQRKQLMHQAVSLWNSAAQVAPIYQQRRQLMQQRTQAIQQSNQRQGFSPASFSSPPTFGPAPRFSTLGPSDFGRL